MSLPLRTSLAIAALCVSMSAQQQPAPAWRLADGTTRNETTRLLTTASADTYPAADGSLRYVTLQLPCSGLLTGSITLSAEVPFAVKSNANVTLPVRFDGQPAIHAGWANLSEHQILLYDLRDLLPPHHRMSIDLPLGGDTLRPVDFDLSGLAPFMREHNCRRRIH